MNGKENYKLLYNGSEYKIPSDLPNLTDVNTDIYLTLLDKGQYEIKSEVSHFPVIQSFIHNWTKNKTPFIHQYEISDYQNLGNEFDPMNDVIQIAQRHATAFSNDDYYNLILNIDRKIKKINQLDKKKRQKKQKYQQIIQYIFNNDEFYSNSTCISFKQKLFLSMKNEGTHKKLSIQMV